MKTTTMIDETTSAGCFLAALSSFAALPAADQQQLLNDVLDGMRESRAELQTVRELLAEAIDGAEDEEIADTLRMGVEGDE